jgi:putative spermidine/putrescine transport system substrate-binding protein
MTGTRNLLLPRRQLLAGTSAALAAAPAIARAQAKRIVVRDDGGVYTKAYSAVFYGPFTKATGIEVVGVQATAEPTAQIRTMVDTRTYSWDMAKISWPAIAILTSGAKPFLEKHGLEGDPVIAKIPPQYMNPYGVGTNIYSTVLAYRSDAFKGRQAPKSWADLWNVKGIPGRRAMRKHPYDTIEEALMASGVPTAQVYPCDLDRAFAALDRIKPDVAVWWTSGAQLEQMLTAGEVDMVPTWVSRAQAAQAAGAPVEIVWDQGIWGCDSWSILAGSPNAAACREFIKFASDPKRMAMLTEFFPAGLTIPEAFTYVKPEIARNCPSDPANIKTGLKLDAEYWLKNQAAVLERFNAWLLK